MDPEKLEAQFGELSQEERDLLLLLSVVHEAVGNEKLFDLLQEVNMKKEGGGAFTISQVGALRNQLIKKEWVESIPYEGMRVAKPGRYWVLRKALDDPRFEKWWMVVRRILPYADRYRLRNLQVGERDLMIAFCQEDISRFNWVRREIMSKFEEEWNEIDFMYDFFHPLDPEWMFSFSSQMQNYPVEILKRKILRDLLPADNLIAALEQYLAINRAEAGELRGELNELYMLRGEFEKVEQLIRKEKKPWRSAARQGWLDCVRGDWQTGNAGIREALKLFRKEVRSKNALFINFISLYHLVGVLRERPPDYHGYISRFVAPIEYHPDLYAFQYLRATALAFQNQPNDLAELLLETPETAIEWMFWGVAIVWNDRKERPERIQALEDMLEKARDGGYRLMALEFASVLALLHEEKGKRVQFEALKDRLSKELGARSIIDAVQIAPAWERALEALLQIGRGAAGTAAQQKESRIVWLIDPDRRIIQPKEQSIRKNGTWTKGRNVALKRMKEGEVDSLAERDREVIKAIEAYSNWYYGRSQDYHINFEKAVRALVGHPLVFLMSNSDISVELIGKSPELIVEEKDGRYEIRFAEEFLQAGLYLMKETPTRYVVLDVLPEHEAIRRQLLHGALQVPEEAKEKMVEAVNAVSSVVTVHSEVGGQAADLPTVEADPTPHLHLLPIGNGFKLEFYVKPFRETPPYFKPGEGRGSVIAEVNGERRLARRDLKAEVRKARTVEAACPALQRALAYDWEWQFDEIETCLEVLLEIEPLRAGNKIILEHPKGEKLRIAGMADFDALKMRLKKDRNWFEIEGDLQVNEDLLMNFQELLQRVQRTDSRFIELSDGQFLALTEQFRRKMREMGTLLRSGKGSALHLHPLAVPAFDDLAGILAGFEADAAWAETVDRLREAREVNPPVPSTFKGDLRVYQQAGYRWLSQLAHWGVGACLADDMGLGKTIQVLALLIQRAGKGPALVAAPASVTRNWVQEARRFAPTLNPVLFGPGDREQVIAGLKPYDLLLCSYGLLAQEGEALAARTFATIVLDEAQAIKNRSTKRSKAAMKLQADFRVITTGTPIENHLGELWNLFNFLNPGLLGSLQHFNDVYAGPIEKYQDRERQQQLQHLIKPFILRRRKNEVLEELPEKTEITLTVELSAEERAFYEALRRSALESIGQEPDGGRQRFQILAELTRLRQACCHPQLIDPEVNLPSAKLELFAEIVEELLDNGHKALVFSQFVKHLRIVEQWVQKQKVPYQYLDGQTPLPQRQKAIDAFQAGEGDLFLISLKAGGTGLNLTAADYVIHLDPWWNPAVEDQASDRAHRIGQQRPVTIYRLVAENTVEEKIVRLHAEKRDLADSLLEGAEASAKLSADELLDLIRTG